MRELLGQVLASLLPHLYHKHTHTHQDKCGSAHNQRCCYLKQKCEGSPGQYGFGHRMRTCGDMYPPPGQFLLADTDFPCGSDCDGCFSGFDDGSSFPFGGNDNGVVVVHG